MIATIISSELGIVILLDSDEIGKASYVRTEPRKMLGSRGTVLLEENAFMFFLPRPLHLNKHLCLMPFI